MAAKIQQYNMYESETGDGTANNHITPSQPQSHNRNLARWKSHPQPRGPSASSSVYSTSSEKGLAVEHALSSSTASVSAAASNDPFPDLEEESIMQSNGSVASATSPCNNSNMHIPIYNHEHGQQQTHDKQESNSEKWSQNSLASTSSFSLKRRSKTRNPLKWLHRCSESRSSVQSQQLEQEGSNTTPITSASQKTSLSDELIHHLRTVIVEKIGILEGKVDALSSSRAFTPQPRRREEKGGVDIGIQANLENQNQQENDKPEPISYQDTLEERISHLTSTNTNLSSLNALLSSDLYSLQNTVKELQEEVHLLREEKFSLERRHGSYDEQRVQIELQVDIIRLLGIVLGRKEAQLESERRMMKLYRDRINGFEGKLEMLRTEWERVLPLVIPMDKGPNILTTVEVDKNK